MAVYKRGKFWWYRFTWNGKRICESTRISNKRLAEQIEAAHRASLARGEVGIRDQKAAPTLKDFAERDFLPYIETRFQNKPKTLEYYRNGVRNIIGYVPLASCALDEIKAGTIAGFVAKRRQGKLQVSTINRQLEVLRRLLKLAMEWGKADKVLPRVEMLPGENHRDKTLTAGEEARYLEAAAAIGDDLLESYRRALKGIRATKRGEQPIKPADPYLLRDAATILMDCGLRPEECLRLKWEHVKDGAVHVPFGKTENARRKIPLTRRASAIIEMRRASMTTGWVFPAPTLSGHIEKSSLKKQHQKACGLAKVTAFPIYTFRHTCLTRWAAHMDPYTLAYLAGHSDFSTTKRYVHPQAHTVLEAIERARSAQGGYKSGTDAEKAAEGLKPSTAAIQ